MRTSIIYAAVAVSLAALAVASPAMAGKFQLALPIAINANHAHQSIDQGQKHINGGANPLQIGADVAYDTGWKKSSQSITQRQSGHINVFPWSAPGQVELAGNIEAFTWGGNKQSITQKQHAKDPHAKGTVQFALGLNVVLFGDDNKQGINQSQNYSSKYGSQGTPQVQVAGNVVLGGDHNDQSITQKQNESAHYTNGTDETQVAVNAVVDGDHNKQSIDQSQSSNSDHTNDTQIAANVVVNGNGNNQSVTQKQ